MSSNVKLNVNRNTIYTRIPTYLQSYVTASLQRALKDHRFHSNNLAGNVCYLCAVNHVHLSIEQLEWTKKKMCSHCDKTVPFYLQRVTQLCGFHYCDIAWYCDNTLSIPQSSNQFLLEGSLTHAIDNELTDYLAEKKNYDKLKQLYPDRNKIYEEILKAIIELYDKALNEIPDDLTTALKDAVKTTMFKTILPDLATINTIRIYYNIASEGDYHKIIQKRWTELKVMGYYINHSVKLLIMGHIDKLYILDDNTFVIRDKKTTRRINMNSTKNGMFYSASLQLGGYNYLLNQFYNKDVHIIGEIELSRYFDILPAFCDVKGFTDVCDKVCEFIAKEKPPIGRPRGGLCAVTTCNIFPVCREKFSKERI